LSKSGTGLPSLSSGGKWAGVLYRLCWKRGILIIYTISNSFLKVEISSRGAELMSIKTTKDGLEYLWQGDEKYWKRRSPILFPIVGRFNDDRYVFKGKEYHIEQHGFTKDSEFVLAEKTGEKVVLCLRENRDTLQKYPFTFKLFITYSLVGNVLSIGHTVINTNSEPMWFSIGEHPGFNCPLFEGEKLEDYRLVFNRTENINRRFLENCLLLDEEEKFLENEKEIQLSCKLFERSAVILKDIRSDSVILESDNHDRKIRVNFKGYQNIAFWSLETGSPFLCIEPWYGIDSTKGKVVDIYEKDGIINLDIGRVFNCGYEIDIR